MAQNISRLRTFAYCVASFGGRANGLALREFNGGDRPLSVVALDRDSQAVKFVEPDVLYRASLSVCEDHGPSDRLRERASSNAPRIVEARISVSIGG
jgi:hypothetical protein